MEQEFPTAPYDVAVTHARSAMVGWALGRLKATRAHVVALCAQHLRLVRHEVHVLSLVARDVGTPWYAKLITGLAVAYAFSPIQLIPSFIPVLGMVDDVVVLSLGIRLALRLIPPDVLTACRDRAAGSQQRGAEAGIAGQRALLVIGAAWFIMTTLGVGLSVALIRRFF